ncbi:MAG TPA: invasion associated locus B family protein [Paraburkholderia sp.]|nr:invasion associated locus B family protein [Paraburkholderia sp.]
MRGVLAVVAGLSAAIVTLDAHATSLLPDGIAQAAPQVQPAAPANAAKPPAKLPQRTETLRFDNWVVACQEFADTPKKRACNAELQAEDSGSARVIIVLTLYINDSKQLVGVVQTPSGVMLAPGVELKLDGDAGDKAKENASTKKFVYESCEPNRCIATLNLDSAFVRDASAASTTTVILRAINGSTVQYKFPIKGFDKAYGQLKAAAG